MATAGLLVAPFLALVGPAAPASADSCWSTEVTTNWVQRHITIDNRCPVGVAVTWKKSSSVWNCVTVPANTTSTFTQARWTEYVGVREC